MLAKNDIILGADLARQKWRHQGQANSTGMPPDQKVYKAEEVTYVSLNIA
jgi:hypothetical protein